MTERLTGDPAVDAFLGRLVEASASRNAEAMTELFAETFLAGDASGFRVVPRDAFVAALPQRAAAAAAGGLAPAVLVSAAVEQLDGSWFMAKTTWHAARSGGEQPLVMRSTYLVHGRGDEARIAAYLNHEGLPLATS